MPIWNDPNAQHDFFRWMQMHMQDEREAQIRDVAKNYAEGKLTTHNRYIMPWTQNIGITHGYVAPNALPPAVRTTVNFNDVVLDIDPAIQGFPRQLLAEMAIREQLDMCDEPGDD